MDNPVNYILRPFELRTNPRDPQGMDIYLQEARKIEKYTDKLDISVLNTKTIVENFLIIANKHG